MNTATKFNVGDKARFSIFNVVVLSVFKESDSKTWYEITATDFEAPCPIWATEEKLSEL